MTDKNTTVGLMYIDYNLTILATVEQLQDGCYTAKQYCDFRYSTNLTRFNYDPFTGEKIDWKTVKNITEKCTSKTNC